MFSVLHKYADGTESLIGEIREVSKVPSPGRSGPAPLFDVMIVGQRGDVILIPIEINPVRQQNAIEPKVIVMNEDGRTVATYWL